MIEDRRLAPHATQLERERQELVAAIGLVATGAASRVVVAGLVNPRELVARLTARATLAGVTLREMPTGEPHAVLVTRRPAALD